MKVAVIGSNCFTGSHVVDALLARPEFEVLGISRSPEYKDLYLPYKQRQSSQFRFAQLDLVRQPEKVLQALDAFQPEAVINVAAFSEVALSHERPAEYIQINTLGVVQLVDHLRRTGYLKRYVHISSAEIFGSCPDPVTEQTLFDPSTPYAVSKAAADMYLHTLMRNFGFPATIIRSTNVYGRHQQLFKIIPRTVIFVKLGKVIELHGGGQARKSFIHIRDVVNGLMVALDKNASGTYHFTVPSDQTVADVVRLTCNLLGHDFEKATRVVGERLGQDARYWLDCSKAERELGWGPHVSLEQGVRETIDWIEANWQAIQREPLTYIHKS